MHVACTWSHFSCSTTRFMRSMLISLLFCSLSMFCLQVPQTVLPVCLNQQRSSYLLMQVALLCWRTLTYRSTGLPVHRQCWAPRWNLIFTSVLAANFPKVLQWLKALVLCNQKCQEAYSGQISSNMICVSFLDGGTLMPGKYWCLHRALGHTPGGASGCTVYVRAWQSA